MVIKEVTAELIDEAIQSLSNENKETAYSFHELKNALDLKIGMRRVIQKNAASYNIMYSSKKPNRLLFTIKIDIRYKTFEKLFAVKANLFHIDSYRILVESCPENIKNIIKQTGPCTKCNPKCYSVKSRYTVDGIEYDPCYIKGHRFENLELSEWKLLKTLVINEYQANTSIVITD